MKGLPTLIRLRTYELEEKRRKLADLEGLKAQLIEAIARIDDDVRLEQQVAGSDSSISFAYAPFAAAAIERRRTLVASAENVQSQIEAAAAEVTSAYQELKKYEVAHSNRQRRLRLDRNRREQVTLDDIAIENHRRERRPPGS